MNDSGLSQNIYKTGAGIDKTQVAWVTVPELQQNFDPYFRGFDNVFPDFYRELEWEREFQGCDQAGGLPSLELVRLMHDHPGNFTTALANVNTVELQQADNDYAVGALIERLANSQYKDNTLVFVLEDDAQDGADHVDAHRSIFFVAGPYVKHGAVVSKPYTTVNLLRTIERHFGNGPSQYPHGYRGTHDRAIRSVTEGLVFQSGRFRLLEEYTATDPNWRLRQQIGSPADSRRRLLGR
jgi:hypothetical protein